MHNAGPNDRWASECSQQTVVNLSLIMLPICRCYSAVITAVFALFPATVIGPKIERLQRLAGVLEIDEKIIGEAMQEEHTAPVPPSRAYHTAWVGQGLSHRKTLHLVDAMIGWARICLPPRLALPESGRADRIASTKRRIPPDLHLYYQVAAGWR